MSLRSTERVRVPTPSELDWLRAELLCDGFALIPSVLPRDLTDRLRDELHALADQPPAQTPASGGPVWCRDHECADSDRPGFEVAGELVDELVALDPLLTLARALLGVECVPVRTEYFGSPGRITGPGPARQDQAFHAREVTGELTVTLWCPLFDVGADDGVREYAFPNA